MKPSKEYNLLLCKPELCEEWDYEKNVLGPKNYTAGSTKKVWWKCKKGHSWAISPNQKRGCPYCSNRKVCKDNCLTTTHPELCKEWNDTLSPNKITFGSSKKVWWKCSNGHRWQEAVYNRTKGSGCPFCAGKRASDNHNLSNIPQLCDEWSGKNKISPYNVSPNSGKKFWWKCNKGHEWKASVNDRRRGNGCPYCSNKKVCKDNYLATTHPELCKEWDDKNITPHDVTFGSSKKVWWKCKNGHRWKAPICKRQTRNCPSCSHIISVASTIWLDSLNISSREQRIVCGDKKFLVDGIYNNTVYEFLGDFWHGNPLIYDPNKKNPRNNKKYGDLLYNTMIRFNQICSKGFQIVYCWEDGKEKEYRKKLITKQELYKEALLVFKTKVGDVLQIWK